MLLVRVFLTMQLCFIIVSPSYASSYYHCQFIVRVTDVNKGDDGKMYYKTKIISERFVAGYSKEFCYRESGVLTVKGLLSKSTKQPYEKEIRPTDRLKLEQMIVGEVIDEDGKSHGDVETWYVVQHKAM